MGEIAFVPRSEMTDYEWDNQRQAIQTESAVILLFHLAVIAVSKEEHPGVEYLAVGERSRLARLRAR